MKCRSWRRLLESVAEHLQMFSIGAMSILRAGDDDRQSSCVSIRTYEPNETETPDTIAAIRRCRVRSLVRDSIGHDKFDLLTSIGAIDAFAR